jgi:twitching motility two-component system response regulator PilG
MSHVQNLQHAVMAAKAGNPSLARVHLQKAAEAAPDDPAVWLWMGWLSESPISMVQCLEAAIQDERHHNIAQAGLAFARALNAYQVAATEPQVQPPVAQRPAETRGPVELVEELVASVAEAQEETKSAEDDWTVAESSETQPASAWDPNGLIPPPLPPEVLQPAQPQASPPLPPQRQAQPVPQVSPEPTARPSASGPAPVWRAASSDWFTVESSGNSDNSEPTSPFAAPQPQVAEQPQPTPVAAEAWSQPTVADGTSPVEAAGPVATASVVDPVVEPSAAEQLDAELERRHVDVPEGPESVSDQSTVSQSKSEMPASPVVTPTAATSTEHWSPLGFEQRTPPPYESPALPTASITSTSEMSTGFGGPVAAQSGPTFEGEPLKPAAHPRTVLVVDDSPTVRKLVTMTLEKNGYRVVSSYDGVAAIREIAEHNPALILMDVNMPRMDGYQLCKLVRKHEATRHIPVLMLSGKDGVFDRLRGKMVGCSGYVPKPFVPEELVQAVGEHIAAVTH